MAGSPQVDLTGRRLFPFGLGKRKIFVTEIKVPPKGNAARHINASRYFPWLWLATVALTVFKAGYGTFSLPCRMSLRRS